MSRLYLVADLHTRASRESNDLLAARLASLRSAIEPGDWVAVLGDLTDDGIADQYDEAARLLEPFRGRLLLCPGNHDAGLLGLCYSLPARRRWARLCARLGAVTEAQVGSRWVVALDSCRYTLWPGDLARGRLGGGELRRARGCVAHAADRGLRTTLLLHHDPYCSDQSMKLDDSEELLGIAAGVADLAWGHTHRLLRWRDDDGRERVSVGNLRGSAAGKGPVWLAG
jgi:3',5'-cyclic AMP phosphodiesterase CpdA